MVRENEPGKMLLRTNIHYFLAFYSQIFIKKRINRLIDNEKKWY